MKRSLTPLFIAAALVQSTWAEYVVRYDFDNMVDGSIEGQKGWNVYDTTDDSVARNKDAFSVKAGEGTLEEETDGALIVRASHDPIRCVTGEPVHWQKGDSLKVEFDFSIVADPQKLEKNEPVIVLYLGNAVLNEKARWEVRLNATPSGDWELSASLPDEASEHVYATKLFVRSKDVTVTSEWFHFVIQVVKNTELASFDSSVRIYDKTGRKVASLRCNDQTKGKVTNAMWNLELVHVGFYSDKDVYGLTSIDNLTITAKKWGNDYKR